MAESMADTSARKYPFISEPCRTVELAFRVGGHIAQLDVQEGQFFRRGEVIAALDARDFIVRKDEQRQYAVRLRLNTSVLHAYLRLAT